jgi:DNA helicase-2/ATP-dependent DNA helicase PcrA
MPLDHLAKLNAEQRRAVEHGVGGDAAGLAAPLLVIAGAGSGKANTLAHRVANLIVNGVDPRRILLITFSRRAASEISRRVESICSNVLGAKAGIMTDALNWAGTFHAIGARLLREYAEQIGLQPNFTIHDQEDSADLMNLFRHQLGFSQTESRFPTQGTGPAGRYPSGRWNSTCSGLLSRLPSVVPFAALPSSCISRSRW